MADNYLEKQYEAYQARKAGKPLGKKNVNTERSPRL